MALHESFHALTIFIFSLFSILILQAQASEVAKTYIIHVEKPDEDIQDITTFHQSFLPDTTIRDALIYSYKHALSGFAVKLTDAEVQSIEKKAGIISAHPQRMYRLSTTRSPSFLGLHPGMGLWNQSNKGKGVIIGLLDTGILPTHPSFSATNMPCPPSKWKGKCEFPRRTDCNNKIIGARSFLLGANVSGNVTPIDEIGHGSHTASTAAGGFVPNACVLGNACGTAAGMAPHAHLAIYKVCTPNGECNDSDIVAGIDAAIEDGVDILSMSLGDINPIPFYNDSTIIGLFAAVQKGIFVSCAAGNSGPSGQTVVNDAPWVMTVGASTIDRSIRATAKLGNTQEVHGESLDQPKNFSVKLLPLVYAGSNGKQDSAFCDNMSLAGVDVKGKVVLCDRSSKVHQSYFVKDAGGAAMILANPETRGFTTSSNNHFIPATEVSYVGGKIIKAYINSTTSPTATISFKGTVIGDPLAPVVASFSSRGPSLQTLGILKPDIIGPGVDILGAVPYHVYGDYTTSKLTFDIKLGTSMSCPHLSGVAALLKSAHPNWSPAAIKSAIMTTADLTLSDDRTPILDQKHTPADVFATGAGHVNQSKATNPGLVYDMGHDEYIPYLCGLGYTDEQVSTIARTSIHCTSTILPGELNYPTFSVSLGPSQTFNRTVTNVGEPFSNYYVRIFAPEGVKIVVKPCMLRFTYVNRKATYSVMFTRINNTTAKTYSQGYLQWISGFKYNVRSVISVAFTG